MTYKIQHLGLGGILDQAIAITRNHFGLLFTIMLMLLVPFSLISGFITFEVLGDFLDQPTIAEIMAAEPGEIQQPEFPLVFIPWMIGLGLLYLLLVLPLTNAAVIQAVARLYLGQPVTAVDAMRHALRRLLPLVGTTILMLLAIIGGYILCIIPGIVLTVLFLLTQHVVVLEELSGTKALRRSWQLVRPQWPTALALLIIVAVIGYAVQIVPQFIPQVHVQLIVNTLLTAVVTILGTAAWVVYYFSCRCALENFDLHYLAEQIGAEPPESDEPPGSHPATM